MESASRRMGKERLELPLVYKKSRSGGIGRRARLKIWCPPGRVGSIPTSGILLIFSSLRSKIPIEKLYKFRLYKRFFFSIFFFSDTNDAKKTFLHPKQRRKVLNLNDQRDFWVLK